MVESYFRYKLMKTVFLVMSLLLVSSSLYSQAPYGAKNDPFRVAMREMKVEYKVLENFENEGKLSRQASDSMSKLIEIFKKTKKMKPGFLKKDQFSSYEKHYDHMIAAVKKHYMLIEEGDIENAQNVYSALSALKKKAHDGFIKQAKKFRGADK